jgi:hypothetical protein
LAGLLEGGGAVAAPWSASAAPDGSRPGRRQEPRLLVPHPSVTTCAGFTPTGSLVRASGVAGYRCAGEL